MSRETVSLCYEVWTEWKTGPEMVAAYWDVLTAWKVSDAIAATNPHLEVKVVVANGMEVWVPTGERRRRTDVLEG